MTEQNEKPVYRVSVQPTPENLAYLASIKIRQEQEPILMMMTEDEYNKMPGHDDIRKSTELIKDMGDSMMYSINAHDMAHLLDDLRQEYNKENPQDGFLDTVDVESLNADQTQKAILVVLTVLDSDIMIQPEHCGTTVNEALQHAGLKATDIFRGKDE